LKKDAEAELTSLAGAFRAAAHGSAVEPARSEVREDPLEAFFAAQAGVGPPPRADVIRFAVQELREPPATEGGSLRLAFLVLSLEPQSAVFEVMQQAAASAFRQRSALLRPFIDAGDLASKARERAWRTGGDSLRRAVEHGNLRGLLYQIARWTALDELRAMARRPRTPFEEAQDVVVPTPPIDQAIDLKDLLHRAGDEVPEWARDVAVSALLGQLDAGEALRAMNDRRRQAGLAAWSGSTMRVWLHRLRGRLRELAADA